MRRLRSIAYHGCGKAHLISSSLLSVCFGAANTTVSILDQSRKTSILSSDFVSTAHEDEDNLENAIPATVIEEEQLKDDNTDL